MQTLKRRKLDKKNNTINRLILVTNREPFQFIERDGTCSLERTTGGLVAALEPAMQKNKGIWISGKGAGTGREGLEQSQTPYQWVSVDYPQKFHDGYYLGFSNRVLWPIFHSMIGNQMRFLRNEWHDYQKVNLEFAQKAQSQSQKGDLIWVHDYQLCLVPGLLREQGLPSGARVGFFLHIPFPAYDLFRTLPWGAQILRGLLGANLVGFHIDEYCQHFFDCVEATLGLECDRDNGIVHFEGRQVHVKAIPIGIDAGAVYQLIDGESTKKRAQLLREQLETEQLIVGVDRLDYTKGIYKRLRAFETLLEQHPGYRGKVSMIQVAVPTRTEIAQYKELRDEIEGLVGHINGIYARPGWTPITYMCRSLPFDELVALYLAGNIGLVTPLRDGMNLVAKEFVAAHKNSPGVLILSELAGAAHELSDALLVNPYDVDGIADAIDKALRMPPEEQTRRMNLLNAQVSEHDVHAWVNAFLSHARDAH
jgi:trehalose 6-phosphate synthase/phosphatase